MQRFRIWHLGLAVLWVAFLSWIAVSGRQTSESATVLTFWIVASTVSLGCTLLVGRPLAKKAMRRLNLGALSLGLFLACLFVGLFILVGVFMDKLESYLRGLG